MYKLDLRLDQLIIKEYPLEDGDTLAIGRHPDNQIVVVHPTVSRRHACIARKGEDLVLWDAGSTNGTLVNGAKVTSAMLKDGDFVGIGETHTLKVSISEAEKEEETLTAERAWRNPEDATAVSVSA
jgi:pSer/pThr/pTyr-binding forkhead associated (FHA) protein